MLLLFILVGLALDFAVLLLNPGRVRQIAAAVVITLHTSLLSYFVFSMIGVWSLLIALVSLFRVFNTVRVAKQRMHETYLRKSVLRTLIWLGGLQLLLFAAAYWNVQPPRALALWIIACTSMLTLLSTVIRLLRAHPRKHTKFLSDKELPSLSILIPARNETEDMGSCIRSVLANDYPKLEVIVLDDCSTDNTAERIKEFANDGVRFISNTDVSETWLQKNLVYQALLDAASGEYVLFCGVDVRFGADTLRKLIEQVRAERLEMLSILPKRVSADPRHIIAQTFRYFWELSLPRFTAKRPPVLSTLWLANRKQVLKAGGFGAAKRMIVPEAFFARYFATKRTYKFMSSTDNLRIETAKQTNEQFKTALRTRYPQLHRRPELVLLLLLAEGSLLLYPFGILGYQLSTQASLDWQNIVSVCLLTVVNVLIVSATNPANSVFALFSFPFAVLTDVVLLAASMWRYELGDITWKERNICLPVMHAVSESEFLASEVAR